MGTPGLDTRKRRMRECQRALIQSMPLGVRRDKSKAILKGLLAWDGYRQAQKVLLFASLADEPDTWPALKQSLRSKKKLYLPAVLPSGRLGLYRVKDLKRDLKRGAFNVLEPKRLKSAQARISEMDLVIVPGLAFDLSGRRLGRGKGYYDRLLKPGKNPFCLALAFENHLVKKIPEDYFDRRVHAILTEKAFYHVHG